MGIIHWVGGLPANYSISLGGNWVGDTAPGTADVGMFDAVQPGPYTLNGSLTLGELAVLGNQVGIRGSITASDLLNVELSVLGGGTLTITSAGSFSGNGIVQVGTTASAGRLIVQGALGASDIDLLADGTMEVTAAAVLAGELNIQSGTLLAVATPGTAGPSSVTLGNAVHLLADATLGGSGGAALTLAGLVDGSGSLVVASGTVTLEGVNAFTGGAAINGGTVVATNAAALGTGLVALNGGTLLASASASFADAFTFQGNSGLAAASGQTLTVGPTPLGQGNLLSGHITIGVPGADGVVTFNLGSTGFGSPSYDITAGTLRDSGSACWGAMRRRCRPAPRWTWRA